MSDTTEALTLCTYCEEMKEEVLDGLCEECESEHAYCTICQAFNLCPDDNPCAHLRYCYAANGWAGAGSDRDAAEHWESFFLFLCVVRGVKEIRDEIAGGDYWFKYWQAIREVDRRHFYNADLTDEIQDAIELGLCWIKSLCAGETPEADALTIAWIDEYLEWQARIGHGEVAQ